jgi:hypothetical protein
MATALRPSEAYTSTSDALAFGGLNLLRKLLPSEQVGMTPLALYAEIRDGYGVDLSDLRRGAIGEDAAESKALRYAAIERVAYHMGLEDGATSVDRATTVDGLSPESFRDLIRRMADLPRGNAPADEKVYAAYKTGMKVAAGTTFATLKQPGRMRAERALATATVHADDPTLGAENQDLAEADARRAPLGDPTALSAAYARLGLARDAATLLAQRAVDAELVTAAVASPTASVDDVIRRARLAFRSQAVAGDTSNAALAALAWQPIAYTTATRVIADARATQLNRPTAVRR